MYICLNIHGWDKVAITHDTPPNFILLDES